MSELNQDGGTPIASATPEAQGASPEVPSAIEQQFAVPNETSATPEGQGATQQPANNDELIRRFQSERDQARAEKLAIEHQAQLLQQQYLAAMQMTQTPMNEPQPDPNQDWPGYMRWVVRQENKAFAQQIKNDQQQWLNGLLQQAQEQQFSQTHSDVPLPVIKQYAQSRGIQNLEDAYKLYTYDARMLEAQTRATQTTVNNFKQPQAMPVRPGGTAPQAPNTGQTYDMDKFFREAARDPSLIMKMPPELRQKFMEETALTLEVGGITEGDKVVIWQTYIRTPQFTS